MTRRAAICTLVSGCALSALDRSEALQAIEPLASGLSNGDPITFLSGIDPKAKIFEQLEIDVKALIASATIACSVSVLSLTGETADLDWYLELSDRATQTVIERRRSVVRVHVVQRKLDSIEPADFFKPTRGKK